MDDKQKEILSKVFAELPQVVQNAITSADLEKHLRELADTHKLHVDQWQSLENEVVMVLYGIQTAEELQKNIEQHVGIPAETAHALTDSITKIVFEPIREELERELGHPFRSKRRLQ